MKARNLLITCLLVGLSGIATAQDGVKKSSEATEKSAKDNPEAVQGPKDNPEANKKGPKDGGEAKNGPRDSQETTKPRQTEAKRKRMREITRGLKGAEQKAGKVFGTYDKDESDNVSAEEMFAMREGQLSSAQKDTIKSQMKTYDDNNDGSLNLTEFINFRMGAKESGKTSE